MLGTCIIPRNKRPTCPTKARYAPGAAYLSGGGHRRQVRLEGAAAVGDDGAMFDRRHFSIYGAPRETPQRKTLHPHDVGLTLTLTQHHESEGFGLNPRVRV